MVHLRTRHPELSYIPFDPHPTHRQDVLHCSALFTLTSLDRLGASATNRSGNLVNWVCEFAPADGVAPDRPLEART